MSEAGINERLPSSLENMTNNDILVPIFLLNVPADHKYAESFHCFCSGFTFL